MNIENIFKNHWNYYSKQGAGILDTIHNLQGKISQEYAGRVIYELLQNAFDPVDENIIVNIQKKNKDFFLIVANDAKDSGLFTFEENFNYDKKHPKNNFNSLCSIADSNKNFTESIGNKGVGFRSVFQVNENIEKKVAYILIKGNDTTSSDYLGFKLYETAQAKVITENPLFKDIENSFKKNGQIDSLINNKIAGYCYPILMTKDEVKEFTSLDSQMKTIIVVPLDEDAYETKVKPYLEKIKKIHFKFVSLKYDKKITIKFDGNDEIEIVEKDDYLRFADVKIDKDLKDLAKKLNLYKQEDEHKFKIKVGCYYKSQENYIYNYLPTEMKSPFCNMDIHSDFLTSLNRESMNLKATEDEGKYNRILLTACVELHFYTLATYLDEEFEELKFKYINILSQSKNIFDKDKFWKYLQIDDSLAKDLTKEIIESVFVTWENFGKFIGQLAKKYFEQESLKIENYDDFWNILESYSILISGKPNTGYKWGKAILYKYFISNLRGAKVIPIKKEDATYKGIVLSKTVFYRSEAQNDSDTQVLLELDLLPINLIEYNFASLGADKLFNSVYLEKGKNVISEYNGGNELFKYFKQIERDGGRSKNSIEENEQNKILKLLFYLYDTIKNKGIKYKLSTHRYNNFSENDTKRQANFAISTIFLKTGDQKYKPAQFCHENEVRDFLKAIIDKDEKTIDGFLRFLGVSFDENIRYTDFKDQTLFDGLDYIPALYQKEKIEKSNTTPYVDHMRIYYCNNKKWECKHPALYYKSSVYNPILTEIKSHNIKDKESLSLVVLNLKDYSDRYNKQIISTLKEPIEFDKNIIFKMYSEIFKKFKKKLLIYKVDGRFNWAHLDKLKDDTYYIAKSKEDFNLLKDNVNILATFSDVSENDTLKRYQHTINFVLKDSTSQSGNNIKNDINSKYMIYILLLITKSSLSDHDFIEDDEKQLQKFNARWIDLVFIKVENIKLSIKYDNKEYPMEESQKPILIDNKVYFKEEQYSDFTDVIVSFFNIEKLKDSVKLILLGDKPDFDKNDLDILTSKWIDIKDTTKDAIIIALKEIGLKNDIIFKLNYTQDDYDCSSNKTKTEDEIQDEINKITIDKQFKIIFDCKTRNQMKINKIRNKYLQILDSYPIHDENTLVRQVCLSESDIYSSMKKEKIDLDRELKSLYNENLIRNYGINIDLPVVENENIQEVVTSQSSVNVDVTKDRKNIESNKCAKQRGLKIEILLIKELAIAFEDEKIEVIKLAKNIYENIKEETLENGDKRFNLKKIQEYDEILKNSNLEEILHISKNLGDGVGFDILFPTKESGTLKLLKVEVKSSEAGKTIYLTENERKQILIYKENKDDFFKIFIYKKDATKKDITDLVFKILDDNKNFKNIKAETWILTIP